jgi:hypothetical protein
MNGVHCQCCHYCQASKAAKRDGQHGMPNWLNLNPGSLAVPFRQGGLGGVIIDDYVGAGFNYFGNSILIVTRSECAEPRVDKYIHCIDILKMSIGT